MKTILLAVLLPGLLAAPVLGESCQQLPSSGGQFGCSVNLNGDALAVGANLDGAGSITPCHRGADRNWTCDEPAVRPADGRPGDEFGRSVAVDEEWLMVGAPFAGGSGVVYIYRRVNGAWAQSTKLTASDGMQGDQFGITLARSGDTLIVGAPNHAGSAGSLSGAVYVFRRAGDAWMQQKKLTAGDAAPFDNFGFSLAIDGDTVVVGAPFHDGVAGNSGAAYVFDRTTWSQRARLWAGDGAADDEFGSAVAVSGNALAVGARTDDVNGMRDAGSAYVYEQIGGWSEVAHLLGEGAGDRFGVAASLSDGQLVIGAFLHDGTGPESGTAYLFQRRLSDGTPRWVRGGDPLLGRAGGDRFGQAVSADGSEILVGAYRAKGGAGSGVVCELGPVSPSNTDLELVKSGPATAKPGQTIVYTLTATNHGPGRATGVHLEDPVPAGLQPVSASLPGGCSIAGGTISCDLPDLELQQSRAVRFRFKVLETCAKTIVNRAILSASEDLSSSVSQVSTALTRTADLALEKSGPASARRGESFLYGLKVVNLGPDLACGVAVSDPVPGGLAARGLPPGCSLAAGEIRCVMDELPAGASRIFSVGFQILPAAGGGRIANTARVGATPGSADPRPANDSATVVTAIAAIPVQVPALSGAALGILALLLGAAALHRLRRPLPG